MGALASRVSTSQLSASSGDQKVIVDSKEVVSRAHSIDKATLAKAGAQLNVAEIAKPSNTEDNYDDDASDDVSILMEGVARDAAVEGSAAGGGGDEGDHPTHEGDSQDHPSRDAHFCHKRGYRKRMLKVVKEIPFVGLFPELQRTRRFEGSGITYAKGAYWVVFDSLRALGKLDLRFSFRGPQNRLVGAVGDESQFEGISYDNATDSFLVLRESMATDEHGLVPLTEELRISEDGAEYELLERCPVKFPLQDVNKGFESLVVFRRDGQRHMLGLCESNFCKTIVGPDAPGLQRGNGRLVWATYEAGEGGSGGCRWEVRKVIKLPKDAYLLDYSAISFNGPFGSDVAVVSQEDAAVWVGSFDWQAMEFVPGAEEGAPAGRLYHFPRTADCSKQYCNVEGVAWIDGERLVFASDKAKGTQDYRCMDKDQSVHIMALP